jgi:hypothetical protein
LKKGGQRFVVVQLVRPLSAVQQPVAAHSQLLHRTAVSTVRSVPVPFVVVQLVRPLSAVQQPVAAHSQLLHRTAVSTVRSVIYR